MKKFSELSLYRKMLSMFLFIFSYVVLITVVCILPISIDRGATLASCLSFGATLYAAVVAYLLLDNWKVQHRAQLKSDYFQKTFDKYIELKDAIYVLQNIHDSWLEDIYRNQGQIDDCEDGGLIKGVSNVKIHLKEIANRFDYYAIIFKDKTYEQTIKEFKVEIDNVLDPILEEYHEREGQVYHSEHFDDAKSLKEQLPIIVKQYDESISDLMSNKILLK
ncbi:hypothetical protein [Acinetobacter terrae]|uniref:hypothetical protein n=1 Tax=Acinetobacter terrae TaxID=2731247 RepID=UPI0007D84272|nr:hypothetical protein [Acinetobacter terrae]NNG75398.1 hypothetical protein [Acinetobacter terrae]OAL77492.1 hypothetical protein AY608_07415 [Acinetobacter terrae]